MRRLFPLLLPLLIAAVPVTQGSGDKDHPVTLTEAKAKEELRSIKEFAGQPTINAKSIEEVLKLSIKNNDLQLDTSISPVENAIVRVPHLPGLAHVRFLGGKQAERPRVIFHYDFEIRDYTVPNAISSYTSASYAAGNLR